MIDDDALEELRTKIFGYLEEHGGPTDRDARDWFVMVLTEGTTPEQAFEPLFSTYFAGSGSIFSSEQWMDATTRLENILLRPGDHGSVYFNYDFDFDFGEGDDGYFGERGAHGTV